MWLLNRFFMMTTPNKTKTCSWGSSGLCSILWIVLGAAIVFFLIISGVKAWRETLVVGRAPATEHSIYVEGKAKISSVPSKASLSIGINTDKEVLADAEALNKDISAKIKTALLGLGVADADVKTSSYSSYPKTVWDPNTGRDNQEGWTVNHQLEVIVRDVNKVTDIFRVANEAGATNTYGPNFMLDDEETLKASVREEAIKNAEKQAQELAAIVGFKYNGIIGYNEYLSGDGGVMPYYSMESKGLGGGPDILPGQEERTLTVGLTIRLVD